MCGAFMPAMTPTRVCSNCFDKDEEMFHKAKNSLRFGEKVSVEELARKTGIEVEHIQRWVRIGRFGS